MMYPLLETDRGYVPNSLDTGMRSLNYTLDDPSVTVLTLFPSRRFSPTWN